MTNSNQHNKKTSPIAAGVAGAIIGAGVAAAAAVVLKDKKNQQKVKEVLHKVKKHAKGYIEKVKENTADQQKIAGGKIEEGKKLISKTADSVKKAGKK